MSPVLQGAGSLAVIVMGLPGAAEQGALVSGAAAGEAGRVPGLWGREVVGMTELQWVGRRVGFDLRTPSVRQGMGSVGCWRRAVC